MRKLLLFVFCGIMLASCNSNPVEKPKDVLDEEQMVAILYDLYVINAMKSSGAPSLEENNITPSKYILHKHKVDSLQFSRSDRYYATNIDVYENIYKRVTQKLQVNKAAADSLLVKEGKQELTTKDSAVLPEVRNTLKNKQTVKKALFVKEDSIKN